MCRRWLAALAILLTLMINTGCDADLRLRDSHVDVYQRIHRMYNRMVSYTADVRLTVKSGGDEHVYELTHQVKTPDKAVVTICAPEPLAGMRTVYNEGSVQITAPKADQSLQAVSPDIPNCLLVHEFFALYYASEETAVSVSGGTEGDSLLLETECLPQEADSYKVTMLLDTKTLAPQIVTVFDAGGNVRMLAEYTNFEFNPNFEDDIFTF